jgi:hypothetical protein
MTSPTLLTAQVPAAYTNGQTLPMLFFFNAPAIDALGFIPPAQHAAIIAGTSTFDCTQYIQNAIDEMIYGSTGAGAVYLRAGLYNTSGPLHLGYGTNTYRAPRLIGPGYAYGGVAAAFRGAVIKPSFSNAPAISVQGVRGAVIQGITILGLNYNYVTNNTLGAQGGALGGIDDTIGASWVDPTLAANADSRYAPYCGIAIDPYGGTRPATSYPDVTYPAVAGSGIAQYGKTTSSDVLIEDCWIGGFVACVVVAPADTDANHDFVKLRRVGLENSRYGVSVGPTQSRNVRLQDLNCNHLHTLVTTRAHGKQNGRLGGPIDNTVTSCVMNLFDIQSTGISGPVVFNICYAETLYRIGDVLNNTSTDVAVELHNCHLNFGAQGDARGVPATVLGGSSQPIPFRFVGGSFTSFPSVCSITLAASDVRIEELVLQPDSTRTNAYEKFAHNALAGGLALNNLGYLTGANSSRAPYRSKFLRYDLDAGTSAAAIVGPSAPSKRSLCTPIYTEGHHPYSGTRGDSVSQSDRVTAIGKGTVASATVPTATLSEKTLTLTFSGRSETLFAYQGPLPGDVIWDSTGSVSSSAPDDTGATPRLRQGATRTSPTTQAGVTEPDDTGWHVAATKQRKDGQPMATDEEIFASALEDEPTPPRPSRRPLL